MMQKFVDIPFTCQVRKVASTGRNSHHDKTTRDWYDGEGVQKELVPDYALVDVHKATSQYKEYIRASVLPNKQGCQPAIQKVIEGCGTPVVAEVYSKAWDYFCCLPRANEAWDFFYQSWPPGQAKSQFKKTMTARLVSEKEFLLGFFELRFALSKLKVTHLQHFFPRSLFHICNYYELC